MIGEEIDLAQCKKCGHRQKVDHLGTQSCRKCGNRVWLDIYSHARYAWIRTKEMMNKEL